MKSFICCCFGVALMTSLALADVSELLRKNSVDSNKASDKSSDSKPKRDASFLIGSGYHGPSYKYLPPSVAANVYDLYGSAHHGLGGSGGGGGGHSSGHHHSHHAGHGYSGLSLLGHHPSNSGHSGYAGHSAHSGVKLSGISHGFGGSSLPAFTGGHSYTTSSLGGHGYATGSSSGGHHHLHSSGHGLSSGHGSLGPVYTAGHGVLSAGPSFSSSHGSSSGNGLSHGGHGAHAGHSYITSASLGGGSLGHKVLTSHSNVPTYNLNAGQVGSIAGLATGYQYAKGLSSSLPSSLHSAGSSHLASSPGVSSVGIGSYANHGFASSGLTGNDLHHSDHVHNGNQEHHYVVTASHDASAAMGQAGSHGLSAVDGYQYEAPSPTYLSSTSQQHHVQPANSYSVPLAAVGASYASNYHGHGSGDESPNYAAGHKGLGHFGYTANKPSVLHTSFIDSGYKTPNYSNAPFKPSTFLGTKYEGSSFAGETSEAGHHNPSQQYLPPSGVGADSTGYDYPVPSSGSLVYQSSADNATPIHEADATNFPPNNLESSYTDVNSNPSANYLPPNGQTYGTNH